jgi:hypothetical protein
MARAHGSSRLAASMLFGIIKVEPRRLAFLRPPVHHDGKRSLRAALCPRRSRTETHQGGNTDALLGSIGSIGGGDVTKILDGGRRHRPNRREVAAGRQVSTPFPGGGNIGSASMAGIEIEKNAMQSCPVPALQAQRVLATRKPLKLRRSVGSIASR